MKVLIKIIITTEEKKKNRSKGNRTGDIKCETWMAHLVNSEKRKLHLGETAKLAGAY